MQSLGDRHDSTTSTGRGVSLRMGTVGMVIMLVVFLVAVVFAANENDVVGWLVVIISLGWLLIFSFVVFSVRTAARKASEKLNEAQRSFNRAAGGQPGTPMVDEATRIRDQKLDHSFQIVQVQARVIRDHLGREGSNQDAVDRALETIDITAHNARNMIRHSADDGPVEGTVVNE